MTLRTIELKNSLFNSPVETTKDRTLSFRLEESLYKLLLDLTKELDTETVSKTARKIIRFYLLNAIYEEEWEVLHSENFKKYFEKVKQAGNSIELDNYRNLLSELSEYVELMRAIVDRINASSAFFEAEMNKLELITSKFEEVDIVWKKETKNVK